MKASSRSASSDRPLIIPLFLPHLGCPHRCVFCNQRTISGSAERSLPTPNRIHREVKRYLAFARKPRSSIQISFFGGNFLGLDRRETINLLDSAAAFVASGTVDSLRFSTRPDTICPDGLAAIQPYPVRTVELGVQSMNDEVLSASRRGHKAAHTIDAATLLKDAGYQVGLQMMVGLPGDDDKGAMRTARQLAGLGPDFVRIYPTLVLAGSPLARLFRASICFSRKGGFPSYGWASRPRTALQTPPNGLPAPITRLSVIWCTAKSC